MTPQKELARWAAILIALPLAGCVAWVRPGTPPEVRDRDLAACEASAYNRVPPDVRTEMVSPGYITPPETWCREHHHHEHCRYMPGYYVPPEFANVDVNGDARDAQVGNCMTRQGYVQQTTF